MLPEEYREIASICTATDAPVGSKLLGLVVDGRALHAGLKVDGGRDFPTWIAGRLAEAGALDGQDFEKHRVLISPKRGELKRGPKPTEYRLTLDLSKRLSMMEGGEVGHLVQGYYIWCEGKAIGSLAGSGVAVGISNEEFQRHVIKMHEIHAGISSTNTNDIKYLKLVSDGYGNVLHEHGNKLQGFDDRLGTLEKNKNWRGFSAGVKKAVLDEYIRQHPDGYCTLRPKAGKGGGVRIVDEEGNLIIGFRFHHIVDRGNNSFENCFLLSNEAHTEGHSAETTDGPAWRKMQGNAADFQRIYSEHKQDCVRARFIMESANSELQKQLINSKQEWSVDNNNRIIVGTQVAMFGTSTVLSRKPKYR